MFFWLQPSSSVGKAAGRTEGAAEMGDDKVMLLVIIVAPSLSTDV